MLRHARQLRGLRQRVAPSSPPRRRCTFGGGLGAGLAVAAWHGLQQRPEVPVLALGDHHDGAPLPPTHRLLQHALKATAASWSASASASTPTFLASPPEPASSSQLLALRRGCVWGQPGRNPYRGTVEQALNMAALPAEVVREIARQVHAGTPTDQLEISSAAILATVSGRQFNPANVAMTYGSTLCLGTRVNFQSGHIKTAALYEAADHCGRVYAVMVRKVCGNVSVLGQVKSMTANGLATGGAAADPNLRDMPALLDGGPQATTGPAERKTQRVPTPGTLALVLPALVLLRHNRRGALSHVDRRPRRGTGRPSRANSSRRGGAGSRQ